ncbi:MAG: DUF115 domain-containing protein [Candidatus Hinthialibacter antarcticus]|nr:DUF115 domain-containing protein [Candidatus Hinthialibacter antarcticus]
MNQTYFESNLSLLERQDPELAAHLRQLPMEDLPVQVSISKTKTVAAQWQAQDGGRPIPLCSEYDPVREATRWAESIAFQNPTNVIVMGCGLGFHLLALLKQSDQDIRFLFIIERDPRILKLAMTAMDLRPLFMRNGVQWIVGAEPKEIPELIGEKRTDIILHNCKILNHDPSLRIFSDYYKETRQQILDALTHDEINLRTTFESQGRNQFNILMNLPAMVRGYALPPLQGLLKGYPAVVSAAGPSLDNNVRLLKELNDRAALLIVDTAQSTFKQLGVEPDAVITGDPTPLNFSHFETIGSLGNAFLGFHPEANHQITRKFLHHPYLLPLYDGESALISHIFNLDEDGVYCEREMNVGHIALNVALLLGCDPIILVGFDYAFPKRGGTTHAAQAAVSRRIDAMQTDGTINIGGKEGKAPEESGKMMLVPGYDGDPVPTTVPFQQYIHALEKAIGECDATIIDATEGGAKFEGAVQMTLQDALNKYALQPGVSNHWASYRANKPSISIQDALARSNECLNALKQAQQQNKQLDEQLRQWTGLLQQPQLDSALVENEWNSFDKRWIEMVEPEIFNASLGNAVQYLYFRRQRHVRPADPSPKAFLRCMHDKYTGIIEEMTGLLDHFIHCFELSMQLLQQSAQGE